MPRIRRPTSIARALAQPRVLWPVLVVVALLSVPAECARIGHPHSLFQVPIAAAAAASEPGTAHTASDHAADLVPTVPSWASPLGNLEPSPSHVHSASDPGGASLQPAAPITRVNDAPPRPGPAEGGSRLAGGIPVVEPMAPAAVVAFGSPIVLLLASVGLTGLPRVAGATSGRRLIAALGRGVEPPPPRATPALV